MLKDILSISGHSGLFKVVSQGKSNIIVESLSDGKRMLAYATSKISALEDISIFTQDGDVKLIEVFSILFEKQIAVDTKASQANLKATFLQLLPNFDQNKVYVSDIKKIFNWYLLLIDKGIINPDAVKLYREGKGENETKEEMTESV